MLKKILAAAFSDESYVQLNDDVKSKLYNFNTKTLINDKLIIYHSIKIAKKDVHDREQALEKIKKHLGCSAKNKLTGVLKKPYVALTNTSCIKIDDKKLKESAKFDGLFAIQTNVKDCDPKEILDNYRGLYQIDF